MKGQAKIEERARQYCAVTVTAVAGLAAAGTAAYGQYSQSKAQEKAAAGAQAAAGADPRETYGDRPDLPLYEDRIGTSESFNPLDDFQGSLPQLFDISRQISNRSNQMRNNLSGGTFRSNLRQQGENIGDMLRGEIPTDVQDQINRYVAERAGGAFDPSVPGGYAGGISQMGSSLARSLGTNSLAIMEKGMSFAPQWEQMIDQFTYKPQDALQGAGVFQNAAQLQLQRDNAMYESGVNRAMAEAQPNPQVAGSINDNLRLDTIRSQADANQMRAMSGLITAGAGGATSIYNSLQPSATSAAVPNVVNGGYAYKPATGFYKVA